ncbi:MAG: histidine kinase N-terminal 7TM domain-containing protein [Gemmatimonadota bacterium]
MTLSVIVALALLGGAGIFAALALLIGRNHYPAGARYMAVATAGIAVWYAAAAGEVLAASLPAAFLFFRCVKYIGIVAVAPSFFLFVLQYTIGQRPRKLATAATYLIPFTTLLLVWSNPWHGLMWQHSLQLLDPRVRPIWGPWFLYVYAPYAYALMATAVLLLVREVLRPDALQRMQAAVLLAAALVPATVNAAYVYSPTMADVQQTPMAFGVTALIAGWGFFRFRIFQLSPLALRAVFDSVGEAVLVVDAAGQVTDINRCASKMFGVLEADVIGRNFGEVVPVMGLPRELLEPQPKTFEVEAAAGSVLFFETSAIAERSGRVRGTVIVARDVTAQRRAENALRDSEHMVRNVLDRSPNGILRLRPIRSDRGRIRDFVCVLANATAAKYVAFPLARLIDARLTQVQLPHTGLLFDCFRRVVETGEGGELELATNVSGEPFWFRIIAVPLGQDVAVTFIDITAEKEHVLRMEAVAQEDPLTGLLNRRGFESDAAALLAAGGPIAADRRFALLYIDLDNFKQVNDTWGHEAGDIVLVEFANRLRRCTRGQDLIARFGGDEFVVLATDCDAMTMQRLVDRIREAGREPYIAGELSLQVVASIGTAELASAQSLPEILRLADGAMYDEKRAAKANIIGASR